MADYESEVVTFRSNGLRLNGTFLRPSGAPLVPAIVIVAGSGPVDRDGLYVPSPDHSLPIYRRWAERAASAGIASLRYDKRFLTNSVDPLRLSQEDQIRDIVAAVEYVASRPEVDASRVFILGHSEGATLAQVAATRVRTTGVIGVVALAFAVDSLVLAQLKAHPDVPGSALAAVEEGFRLLREGGFPSGGEILGAGEAYWRELIHYTQHADSIAMALGKPFLVVQGLADENLPAWTLSRNVQAWQSIVARVQSIDLRTYPGVSHNLLIEGTETSAEVVLADVMSWIRER